MEPIRLVLDVDADGYLTVTGPLDDSQLLQDIFEAAQQLISEHADGSMRATVPASVQPASTIMH